VRLPAPKRGVVLGGSTGSRASVIRSRHSATLKRLSLGDIVLHDGVPNGERDIAGECIRIRCGFSVGVRRNSPLSVHTRCSSDEDARALVELFEAKQFGAEDWTTNVRQLCKSCQRGSPPAATIIQFFECPSIGIFVLASSQLARTY